MRVLDALLRKAIRKGRLTVVGADGVPRDFGGQAPGPDVTIRFADRRTETRIALNPELAAAEAYMDGAMTVDGDVHHLMELFFVNRRDFDMTPAQIFWHGVDRRLRRFQQHNPIARARANARSHYDIGEEVYRRFLDRDMQYSCGYFPTGDETLEEAQVLKKRHIAAKLDIRDGHRILDIGCGWGGMALYLAHLADVEVLGVTLSERQHRVATRRAEILGVSDRVRFELRDYREVDEPFDRIVSVGMLEHVGAVHLQEYFLTVRDRLPKGGVALIHTISSKSPPGVTGPFLRKHIFPGGYSPALSETAAAIERTGLWILDSEIWRVHYGHTLHGWRDRFAAARDEVEAIMGERFCRMWELYLSICECAFMLGTSNVLQLQLGRERDAVPLTRDYIGEEEARIAALEPGFEPRVTASAFEALDAPVGREEARREDKAAATHGTAPAK
jgi:cyclopropane-fatty-acyl-phospholipid synthase